jgi:glycosyltransferase involved in cell wall biosynthesis
MATWYPSVDAPIHGIFVRETARAIALRHDVAVLYAQPTPARRPPPPVDAVEAGLRTVRVPFSVWPTSGTSLPLRLRALWRGYRHLIHSGFTPEIVQAHVYLAGAGAIPIARSAGVGAIVVEHLGAFVAGTLGAPQRRLARAVYEAADLVCPVSADLGRRLAALAPRARICPVPNAVDIGCFHPPAVKPQHDHVSRLLVVALLRPGKGIDHLLQALPAVRETQPVELDIAGDGPSRRELERLARQLGLAQSVRFLGLQEPARVAELMRVADVLVLPSLWENLPGVVIEAQATGLPVVASDVGGVRELVDERAGRLVPPGDRTSLASAIVRVLDHPQAYDRAGIAARARRTYGLDAISARWDGIFQQLLRRRPRCRRAMSGLLAPP